MAVGKGGDSRESKLCTMKNFLDIDSDFRYKLVSDKRSLSYRSSDSCKKQ